MPFKLPRYSDLTDSQRTVLNLPIDNNHIIMGAPGTGKSVIAIYRAVNMSEEGKDVLMLVYNRPLMSYISGAIESLEEDHPDIDITVNTWQSWISNFYKEYVGKSYPRINGEAFTYDWEQIKSDFDQVGLVYDHVIIDEAQDVPVELMEALLLISDGESCFMDIQQTLNSTYTSYQDAATALGLRTGYRLRENFRNPKEIYEFAKLYNPTADAHTVRSAGIKPFMIQCSDYGHSRPTELTSQMVRIIKRNFGLNFIGVFTTNRAQNKTYEELKACLPDMNVFMYKSGSKSYGNIEFDEPGVYIFSFNCMKGLEFDAVLIPRCEKINTNENSRVDNNMFYVAVTRASEQVYCFYFDRERSSDKIDVFGPLVNHENLLTWEALR